VMAISVASPLQAQTYQFAGIPWGSNGASVKRLMAAQSLQFVQVDSDGDYRFEGSLAGYKAVVFALMANGSLAKVSITLVTPNNKAREEYQDMKRVLQDKYGPPTN